MPSAIQQLANRESDSVQEVVVNFAKLAKVMFATLNELVCNDVSVKLVHLLSVDAEPHDMIESALSRCAAKVSLQMPHI